MAQTRNTRPRAATPARRRATTGDNLKPRFVIDADDTESEIIPVQLVGKLYKVQTPKSSLAMRANRIMAAQRDLESLSEEQQADLVTDMLDTLDSMISAMFGDDAPAIRARLDDPNDKLDYPHIYRLADAIGEDATGNPPT